MPFVRKYSVSVRRKGIIPANRPTAGHRHERQGATAIVPGIHYAVMCLLLSISRPLTKGTVTSWLKPNGRKRSGPSKQRQSRSRPLSLLSGLEGYRDQCPAFIEHVLGHIRDQSVPCRESRFRNNRLLTVKSGQFSRKIVPFS